MLFYANRSSEPKLSLALGTMTTVAGGASPFTGGRLPFLICLATGAIGLYAILGGHLWADSEGVGGTRIFEVVGFVSPRRAGIPSDRRRPILGCSFVRKDGSVAFTTPSMVDGFRQLMVLGNDG